MNRVARRRSAWALGLSLALHVLTVLFLLDRVDELPPPSHSQAIELEIVDLPEEQKEEVAQPEAPKAPVQPSPPSKAPAKKKSEAPVASSPAAPAPQAAAPSAQGSNAPDAPKTMTLVPSSEFAIKAGGNGVEPEAPRGHTVLNSDQERPDPVAMNEYTQEKLGRRMGSMVEGMVADTQAKNGLVDPYFMGARSALEGDLSKGNVPLPREQNGAREGIKGFLQTQERFGKTGNPFAAGASPKWDDFSLARNENQGMAMQQRDPEWAGIMRQAEQSMAAGEATRRATDHVWAEAIVELVQEPDGAVADAHIVKSSGYKNFDEYVLHRARKVFLTLDDPPETGHGISSEGWRSLWRFSYWPMSVAEKRGQRMRVELLRVQKGQGSGNPLEHVTP